jgi:UDP-N-acetylmuramate--alanine ligase
MIQMKLQQIHSIYFIGIGGIGMSGLARYFHLNGRKISGYDKTATTLTDELIQEGIEIHFEEDLSLIPKNVDLVVYTPAVPSDHVELTYYRDNNYNVVKRSDLLEALTKDLFTIAVAGTHGKTTTTSMIAHILKSSGYDCTAFLGGIAANYETNFLAGKNNTVVVEADEFDRSFLKLHPDIAVITSSDPDHLDIYGNKEEVEKAYGAFAGMIKENGQLITKKNLSYLKYVPSLTPSYYAISGDADFVAENTELKSGTYSFDFKGDTSRIDDIHLGIAGYHNVENAIVAGAVASRLHIAGEKIRQALQTFKGVKRRFEFIVRNGDTVYIDDYAHHPAEIRAFLQSVREIFPDRIITCIFQPHLYSRTRDFADEFGQALSLADQLILLPIYPARELPIPGIDAALLLAKVSLTNKMICEKHELVNELKNKKREVIVTVGAGDIDQLVAPIKKMLEEKSKVKL